LIPGAGKRHVKPDDIEALAAKMAEFIVKPLLPEEKQAQIHAVAEKYDWEAIAAMTYDVYKHVLGHR